MSENEYWYIVARPEGKVIVLGPYFTEYDANENAVKLNCTYEVITLSTRNRQEAYSRVRHMIYKGTGDLALALRRQSHII